MVTHNGWVFTQHAEARRIEMRLTRNRVVEAIENAAVSWRTSSHDNNGTTFAEGDLTVVADPDTRSVLTILWWTDEEYERAA